MQATRLSRGGLSCPPELSGNGTPATVFRTRGASVPAVPFLASFPDLQAGIQPVLLKILTGLCCFAKEPYPGAFQNRTSTLEVSGE